MPVSFLPSCQRTSRRLSLMLAGGKKNKRVASGIGEEKNWHLTIQRGHSIFTSYVPHEADATPGRCYTDSHGHRKRFTTSCGCRVGRCHCPENRNVVNERPSQSMDSSLDVQAGWVHVQFFKVDDRSAEVCFAIYIHIHIYIYIYHTHTHTHTYIHTYIRIYIHTYIHTYIGDDVARLRSSLLLIPYVEQFAAETH